MKMRILTLLMLTWAATATAWAGAPAQPGKQPTAYLMVYHKDQDHGLHIALSDDGYTWTALNDDKPVIPLGTITIQEVKAPSGYYLEGQNAASPDDYLYK